MGLYHVAISGRDRRHLSALSVKLRVVVVGYRESERGIVVDAYVPEKKIPSSRGVLLGAIQQRARLGSSRLYTGQRRNTGLRQSP